MAGPFQRHGEGALVAGAGARLAARLDLAPLRQIAAQPAHILIVDIGQLLGAEPANFAAWHETVFGAQAPARRPAARALGAPSRARGAPSAGVRRAARAATARRPGRATALRRPGS